MGISRIHCVLVPPLKNEEVRGDLTAAEIRLEGEVFELIQSVFLKAPRECGIPILFCSDSQSNPIRTSIIELVNGGGLATSVHLFSNLALVTTRVSGLSLCFAVIGELNAMPTVLLARFPATQGIRAHVTQDSFEVEVLPEVFLRFGRAYKAALYQDRCIESGFWAGYAVDKQTNDSARELSTYWIQGFLQSQFRMTPRRGTLLVAKILRKAMTTTADLSIKREIMALAAVLPNREGQFASLRQICDDMSISSGAKNTLRGCLENHSLFEEPFEFCGEEYSKQIVFKSLHLDNGAVLTALNTSFDRCFVAEPIDEQIVRYTTQGKVDDIRVKRTV